MSDERDEVTSPRTRRVTVPMRVTDLEPDHSAEDHAEADDGMLDAVMSVLPSGLLVADGSGRITHVNRSATRILEHAAGRLVGARLTDLRGELEAMLWPADKGEVLLTATGRPGELVLSEARVLGFSSRHIPGPGGAPRGVVVSFSDITQSKAQQRDQAHRQRLADIGKVVSTIAHEIRNPVFAICSLAQVLQGEPAITTDPDLAEIAGRILSEGRRVSRLVDDLLAFGAERPIEVRKMNMLDMIETLVEDVEQVRGVLSEDRAAVALEVEVRASVRRDPAWHADPEALRRVLANLIRNALQAVVRRVEQDPSRTAGRVQVIVDRGPDWFEVTVDDDGVGIAPEQMGRVFEAFFTTRHDGTGLGLSVCQRIVQQHGGTLALESVPGRGTRATVHLPA